MTENERKFLNILLFMKEGEVPLFMLPRMAQGVYKVFDETFLVRYTVMVTADNTYEVYFEHPETEETLFVGEYDEADNLQWMLDSNDIWEQHLPTELKQLLVAVKEATLGTIERLAGDDDDGNDDDE